jgi:hypothetical protein
MTILVGSGRSGGRGGLVLAAHVAPLLHLVHFVIARGIYDGSVLPSRCPNG